MTSGVDFVALDYVLLGEFGSETSEVVQIGAGGVSVNTLTVGATLYSHPIDTKVTILKYNKVVFYRTTTATFVRSDANRLTVMPGLDIQCDSSFTKYYDVTNSTGFGWFEFYNVATTKYTANSNVIKYAGFSENSVKKILDNFFSLLNNKEQKLIDNSDALRWLNESYVVSMNELNLVNEEYAVPAEWSFTVSSSSDREQALEDDFFSLISVTDSDGEDVPFISLADVPNWDDEASSTSVRYFLRGNYIGISPVPSSSTTYYVYYKKSAETLDSYDDDINLPSKNYYFLVDGMLARAASKLEKSNGPAYEKKFQEGIQRMKITAHKQSAHNDSFSISNESNV